MITQSLKMSQKWALTDGIIQQNLMLAKKDNRVAIHMRNTIAYFRI